MATLTITTSLTYPAHLSAAQLRGSSSATIRHGRWNLGGWVGSTPPQLILTGRTLILRQFTVPLSIPPTCFLNLAANVTAVSPVFLRIR